MHRHRVLSSALFLVAVVAAGPPVARATDAVSGMARLNAQSITLAHGLAVLDPAKRSVALGLFAAPPSAADADAAVTDGIDGAFGVSSPAKGAYVLLKLGFPSGAAQAEHVSVCEVDFYNFADSPLQTMWLGDEQCGVTELRGDLRPGGVVHGKLAGASPASSGKAYSWDLAFTVTLRAGR